MDGDPAGSRTQNTRLKRPVLCQLSYRVEGPSLAQIVYRGQEQKWRLCPKLCPPASGSLAQPPAFCWRQSEILEPLSGHDRERSLRHMKVRRGSPPRPEGPRRGRAGSDGSGPRQRPDFQRSRPTRGRWVLRSRRQHPGILAALASCRFKVFPGSESGRVRATIIGLRTTAHSGRNTDMSIRPNPAADS